MSRTITALFDTRADAEAGKQRLLAADVDANHVQIHDQDSLGSQGYSTHSQRGVWNNTKNAFLPDEDRHTYEEGIRRGGVLLTADIDGDADDAGRAVQALEAANSVDIDERAGQWRQQGWDYNSAAGAAAGGTAYAAGRTATTGTATTGTTGTTGGEEHIQLAEEQLVVGKREVQHGGVRVRSYVTERPVQEQVRLREEHVNIERRPVSGAVSGNADALFQERTVDVTATAEEAVVGKTARVTEELVVSKTADTRVETINETVRKTEVEIDQTGGRTDAGYGTTGTSGTTGTATGAVGGVANKAAGLGQEALGNVKQAVGGLTGSESLKQSGQAQERAGEARQGKRPD